MADYILTQTGVKVQEDLNTIEAIQGYFSTSATYAKDALCIYDGKLWQCHTAVVSAGAWTGSTNWTQIHLSNLELVSNKVTSISSNSTDAQYASAKCLYDTVGNIETLLAAI